MHFKKSAQQYCTKIARIVPVKNINTISKSLANPGFFPSSILLIKVHTRSDNEDKIGNVSHKYKKVQPPIKLINNLICFVIT